MHLSFTKEKSKKIFKTPISLSEGVPGIGQDPCLWGPRRCSSLTSSFSPWCAPGRERRASGKDRGTEKGPGKWVDHGRKLKQGVKDTTHTSGPLPTVLFQSFPSLSLIFRECRRGTRGTKSYPPFPSRYNSTFTDGDQINMILRLLFVGSTGRYPPKDLFKSR